MQHPAAPADLLYLIAFEPLAVSQTLWRNDCTVMQLAAAV
jgi:hypothetical protein